MAHPDWEFDADEPIGGTMLNNSWLNNFVQSSDSVPNQLQQQQLTASLSSSYQVTVGGVTGGGGGGGLAPSVPLTGVISGTWSELSTFSPTYPNSFFARVPCVSAQDVCTWLLRFGVTDARARVVLDVTNTEQFTVVVYIGLDIQEFTYSMQLTKREVRRLFRKAWRLAHPRPKADEQIRAMRVR